MYKLYAKYHVKGNHSLRYHILAKKLEKDFNKTLCTILDKMADKHKMTWPNKLFDTVVLQNRDQNLNSSHYMFLGLPRGCQLPPKIQLMLERVVVQEEMTNDEKANLYLAELETLDEERLAAK